MKQFKHDFCCNSMLEAIEKDRIIDYYMRDRTYDIPFGKNRAKRLFFCPWCGTKLPKGLVNEMLNVLQKEYGIPWEKADICDYTNIPEEFKTDEWWKKRGL